MDNFVAVIMAGGKGQRFWPLSTEDNPKQFLDLERTGRSLLQATYDRLLPLCGSVERLFVITGDHLADKVREHLPELPAENLLLEPTGRDTAPAVALSAIALEARFGNPVMGVFTADHRVGNVPAFRQSVRRAIDVTRQTDGLTTLGITPSYPATGFGYIQAGDEVAPGAHKVARFVEKPDLETAEHYLQSGHYYWNNGIFVWHVATILAELGQHAPELLNTLRDAYAAGRVNEVFPTLDKISIDYAVLEKTARAYVVPASYDWDDIGDWLALERLIPPQEAGNTVVGRHIGLDTARNIVYTSNKEDMVVTLGVEDLVIVKRGDTVLVLRKDRIQDIKQLLQDERLHHLPLDAVDIS